jgi:hypothetical protein
MKCFFGHKWEYYVKGIEKCGKCGKNRCKLSDFFTLEEKRFIKEQFAKLPHLSYGFQAEHAAIDIVQKIELEEKVELRFLELIKATLDLIVTDSMMNNRPQTSEWGRNMSSIFTKIEKL